MPQSDTQLLSSAPSESPVLDPDLPADELDPPQAEKE